MYLPSCSYNKIIKQHYNLKKKIRLLYIILPKYNIIHYAYYILHILLY